MKGKTEKIREKIVDTVKTHGRIRTVDLLKVVQESVKCSPAPVYAELDTLCKSDIIKKIDKNKANVEYIFQDTLDNVDLFLSRFEKKSNEYSNQLHSIIDDKAIQFSERDLSNLVYYVLQSVENTRMELNILEQK